MFEIKRPTELTDHLWYLSTCDLQSTTASDFAEAWNALDLFIEHSLTEEGKEKLRQCKRNLHVAFEMFESGDTRSASEFVEETIEMFQKCRKFIAISDE